MFTSIDKALVALVMALIYVANTFLGINFGITEETVQTIVALVTPVLVWLVPNKAA
jgi:ribonuclease PH